MSLFTNPSGEDRTPFDDGDSVSCQTDKKSFRWLTVLWTEMPRANQLAVAAACGALTVIFAACALNFLLAPDTTRLKAKYPQVIPVDSSQTVLMEPKPVSQGAQAPIVQTKVMQPSAQDETASESLTAEDLQKLQMRRREDQIIKEKRLLEDRKRAIEQQIVDKQLEEQRAAEDKKRWEERQAHDKQEVEQRQQEARQKLEEEQRKLEEEQRKLAEAH
jgi:hypothetical protein